MSHLQTLSGGDGGGTTDYSGPFMQTTSREDFQDDGTLTRYQTFLII